MAKALEKFLLKETKNIRAAGLLKKEFVVRSQKSGKVKISSKNLVDMCSEDYLGLSSYPTLIKAAKEALDEFGYGLSSSRILCGTQEIHQTLEKKLTDFFKTQDSLLFNSEYCANIGLFESLLDDHDMIFCDDSIDPCLVDGVRLSMAKRHTYHTNDMEDLEDKLKRSRLARFRMIVTDGVYPLEGVIANLPDICQLAKKYDAMVMVYDARGAGILGTHGRGTHEYQNVIDKVDIISGGFSKALGGVSGGYVTGSKDVVSWLRQRSRPYLFSSSMPAMLAGASQKALELIESDTSRLIKLHKNSSMFRERLKNLGFRVLGDHSHPMISIMLRDAVKTQRLTNSLFQKGVYISGFCYPVVPKHTARVIAKISAKHTQDDLTKTLSAFEEIGKELEII